MTDRSAKTSSPPSLDQLAAFLGEPDEQLRNALFRRVPEGTLVEHGTRVDSPLILEDVPGFVQAGLDGLKRLLPEQRSLVKLPPGLFALLVDETRMLDRLRADHEAMLAAAAAGTRTEREAALRTAMRAGLALRSVTVSALRNVLGREGMHPIETAIGTGDTASKLAAGLEELARQVRQRLRGDAIDRYLFAEFGLDEACAGQLDEAAARVRKLDEAPAPPDRVVTQRMLDLQDGRVLHLIAMVLRAFRAAHKADGDVPEPDLPTIGWLFDARSTRRPAQLG